MTWTLQKNVQKTKSPPGKNHMKMEKTATLLNKQQKVKYWSFNHQKYLWRFLQRRKGDYKRSLVESMKCEWIQRFRGDERWNAQHKGEKSNRLSSAASTVSCQVRIFQIQEVREGKNKFLTLTSRRLSLWSEDALKVRSRVTALEGHYTKNRFQNSLPASLHRSFLFRVRFLSLLIFRGRKISSCLRLKRDSVKIDCLVCVVVLLQRVTHECEQRSSSESLHKEVKGL